MSMAISTIKAFLEKQGCIFNVANPPEIQEIYLGFLENTDQGIVALQKYLNGQSYTKNRIQQITTKFISDQLYKNFLVYLNTPTDESARKVKQEILKFNFKLQKAFRFHGVKYDNFQLARIAQDIKGNNQQSLKQLLKKNNIENQSDKILESSDLKNFQKNLKSIWTQKHQKKIILHPGDDFKLVQLYLENNTKKIRKTYRKLNQNVLIQYQKYYQSLKNLRNANIVDHQEVHKRQKQLVIITKFVESITLQEFIKKNPDKIYIIQIIKQIQSALQYLKKNGIQHGDLRPANILITNQNKPILINFPPPNYYGFSQKSMKQRQLYKAPKQLVNKSDLWGLAIILLQLNQRIQIEKLVKNKQTSMYWLTQQVQKIQNEQILCVAKQLLQKMDGNLRKLEQVKQIKQTYVVEQQRVGNFEQVKQNKKQTYLFETVKAYKYEGGYDNLKRIKKILKNISSSKKNVVLQFFKRLISLNHRNIITYQDAYIDNDDIIVITAQIKGISLRDYVRRDQKIIGSTESQDNQIIYQQKILKFYHEISSALKYLKSKNIIHEVICPDDILMSEQNKPIIVQLTPLDLFQNNTIQLYKFPKNILPKQQLNADMWPIAMILLQLYFKKEISEIIRKPQNPVQNLKTITKQIQNQKIRQIIEEIVFPEYKRKVQDQKVKIIKKEQVRINSEIKIQQKVIHYNKIIKFTPEIVTKKDEDIKIQKNQCFNQSFVNLLMTQQKSEVKNHIIYETYQRYNNEMIDPISSKQIEKQFIKQTKNNKINPLLILGSVLRQDNKTVHYSKQSTSFSIISLIMLATQIEYNQRKIRSLIDYSISKEEFENAVHTNSIIQQIMSILKKHYYNQNNPIIIQIEWYNKQKIMVEYYYPQNYLGSKYNIGKGVNKVKQISNENLMNAFLLSPQDLDSRGDIDFVNNYKAQMQTRGGLPYFQPNGWIRYGLKVDKFTKLDGNDKWLRMDGNDKQWAVLYHGIRGDQVKKVAKIIIQSQLKAGSGQAHQNSKLFVPRDLYNRLKKNPTALQQYKKEKQVGKGVYGSPLINEVCLGYTTDTKIANQSYRVAFQCRINPEKVYISGSQKSYWVIRESKYIRPYGLLIGKKSDIQKQRNITAEFSRLYKQFEGTGINLQKLQEQQEQRKQKQQKQQEQRKQKQQKQQEQRKQKQKKQQEQRKQQQQKQNECPKKCLKFCGLFK